MSYYSPQRGDYKTYGYARGDPGFLSDVWKGVKDVGKKIFEFSPAGQIYKGLTAPGGTPPILPGGTPAGFAGPPMPGAKMGAPTGAGGCCPSGYHLSKDGSGRCVRNRRMNPTNPKALRRAMRRVQGFEKLAKRTIQFTRRTRLKK